MYARRLGPKADTKVQDGDLTVRLFVTTLINVTLFSAFMTKYLLRAQPYCKGIPRSVPMPHSHVID